MKPFDLSDCAFAGALSAIFALGWTDAPALDRPKQHPLARAALESLEERHLSGRRCEASGTIRNVGSAAMVGAELALTFEPAETYSFVRVTTAATLPIRTLDPGEGRSFALPYRCDDALGSRRYRLAAATGLLPVLER